MHNELSSCTFKLLQASHPHHTCCTLLDAPASRALLTQRRKTRRKRRTTAANAQPTRAMTAPQLHTLLHKPRHCNIGCQLVKLRSNSWSNCGQAAYTFTPSGSTRLSTSLLIFSACASRLFSRPSLSFSMAAMADSASRLTWQQQQKEKKARVSRLLWDASSSGAAYDGKEQDPTSWVQLHVTCTTALFAFKYAAPIGVTWNNTADLARNLTPSVIYRITSGPCVCHPDHPLHAVFAPYIKTGCCIPGDDGGMSHVPLLIPALCRWMCLSGAPHRLRCTLCLKWALTFAHPVKLLP